MLCVVEATEKTPVLNGRETRSLRGGLHVMVVPLALIDGVLLNQLKITSEHLLGQFRQGLVIAQGPNVTRRILIHDQLVPSSDLSQRCTVHVRRAPQPSTFLVLTLGL